MWRTHAHTHTHKYSIIKSVLCNYLFAKKGMVKLNGIWDHKCTQYTGIICTFCPVKC